MARIRLQRVAEQMKQVVSRVVTQELKDPRCGFITIISVKVAPDLKTAQVNFSVLGSDAQKRSARRALESARGYVQARVADETALKYTPVISFHLDESAERDIDLSQRIDRVVKADERARTARVIRAKVAAGSIPPEVVGEISEAAAAEEFTESIATLLTELIDIDTTPQADVAKAAAGEQECLKLIEAEFAHAWGDEARTEFLPIDPEIEKDEAYVPPRQTAADGAPLAAEKAYKGRGNLIAVLARGEFDEPAAAEGSDALEPMRLAFHTHVATATPHAPSSREGDVILGPGACDAKGQVAMILGAFRLLKHIRDSLGIRVREDLSAQFVIGSKSGGNGSLCIGFQDPFVFDGIVVCEPTDGRVRTAGGEPGSALAVYATESCKRAGLDVAPQPTVCEAGDARLFAGLFHDRDVIVFGPGRPRQADSARESISLHEIAAGAKMLAFLVLESAGPMA